MESWAAFEHGAKFQQMVSEIVSHTEESIDQLEPFAEEEWAKELLAEYNEELPVLREFYANIRRYVNECGHDVIDMLDPTKEESLIVTPEGAGDLVLP